MAGPACRRACLLWLSLGILLLGSSMGLAGGTAKCLESVETGADFPTTDYADIEEPMAPSMAENDSIEAAPFTARRELILRKAPPPPPSPPPPPVFDKCTVGGARASSFYGCNGNRFQRTGPLQDWSQSGFAQNMRPVPSFVVSKNIKDFGAVGDGNANDTLALINAVAATTEGTALLLPAGTYRIERQVKTSKQIVIRGEGKGVTTLYFPFSMREAKAGYPDYSLYNPGGPMFLAFTGGAAFTPYKNPLSQIAARGYRGDLTLRVTDTSLLPVGKWFLADIYATAAAAGGMQGKCFPPQSYPTPVLTHFVNQVVGVGQGLIYLRFSLPYDILDDGAAVPSFPLLFSWDHIANRDGSGVEDLSIVFPLTPYPGHLKEAGYNAIGFSSGANMHVRGIEIVNADFGISSSSYFGSYNDIVIRTTGSRGTDIDSAGHHGIAMWNGASFNVIESVVFKSVYRHEVTVAQFAVNNVFKNIVSVNMCFDHHHQTPYGNLFSNINLGLGTRWLNSGGTDLVGYAHAGSYNTYWNLRTSNSELPLPIGPRQPSSGSQDWTYAFGGDQLNFIGPKFTREPRADLCTWNRQTISLLYPGELHGVMKVQLKRLPPQLVL